MKNNGVDVIVVSFNTRARLLACLSSLRDHTPDVGRVIVVDNASRDGSADAARQMAWDRITVIENHRNRGYARACNQGLLMSGSTYAVLLNSDVTVTPGWWSALAECFEQDPRIAVVGPKMVDPQGRINGAGIIGTLENHWPRGYLEPDREGLYDAEEDCVSVCGACYAIRRDALRRVGFFDENFFFYFEETDFSFRVRDRGYRVVYCPASRVIHDGGQSCSDHALLQRYFAQSRAHFYCKWGLAPDASAPPAPTRPK